MINDKVVHGFRAATTVMVAFGLAVCVAKADADLKIQGGQKIAFLGDSITLHGASKPNGFVRLTLLGLRANGLNITSIPAGVSGNKSTQMLQRLDRDVLEKKPEWVVLSCGVNDVWHGQRGVSLEDYTKNMTQIVDKCYAAGTKVMILTATPIGEDLHNEDNQRLAAYNDALRRLAAEKGCLLADLDRSLREAIAAAQARPGAKGFQFTTDGVHMNPLGNRIMAVGVLHGFGFDAEQMRLAQAKWDSEPDSCDVTPRYRISFAQYEQLMEIARKRGKSLEELVNESLANAVDSLITSDKAAGATSETPKD